MNTGQAIYPVAVDTIDLLDTVVRTNNGAGNNQIDINISRISEPTYLTIPNKNATGRPIQVWINRQSGNIAAIPQTTLQLEAYYYYRSDIQLLLLMPQTVCQLKALSISAMKPLAIRIL